jgi:hypothetical protein
VFGIAISKIKSAILNQIIKNESFEIVLFFKKKKKLRFENVKKKKKIKVKITMFSNHKQWSMFLKLYYFKRQIAALLAKQ